ncbi:DUF2867 domain-containing protein [Dinoroseobacter sp. S375]|uniref:DUF2867 domain-containing protein n=1 Tax=Dinoroseobacter sp. S375 TaxID=3415136 RepID=UPI003C7B9D1C
MTETGSTFVPLGEANALLLAPVEELDYFDTRAILLPRPVTPLEAWNLTTERPLPLLPLAFRIRDAICAPFGVAPIGGFSGTRSSEVAVGDQLDFFLVEHVSDTCLCLTARDRHLDVLTCLSCKGRSLAITSSVRTHNAFGRLYMLPVGPAHKLIVSRLLKRVADALEEAPAG